MPPWSQLIIWLGDRVGFVRGITHGHYVIVTNVSQPDYAAATR